VRQLLTESALLAGMAATVAIAVAYLAGRFVQQTFLPGFAWDERLVDARLLGVTTGLVALTTLAAGLAPAWRALSTDMVGSLGAGTRTSTGRTGGLRSGLLIAQVALSVVLLVGAGLFVRSFSAVQTIDVGMDLDRVILARLPERPGVPLEEAEALHDEATARLAAVPGVEGVTITRNSSPMGISSATTVLSEGETLGDSNGRAAPSLSVVQPDYFAVLGAALDRGRLLLDRDRREGSRVAVINRALEAERWPDVDPVGQCVYFGQERNCTRIVGVVENIVLYDRVANDTSQLYVLDTHPVADESKPRGVLLRTEGKAADVAPAVRAALQSLRSDMPFVPVDTMETLTAPQLQPWRLGATMFVAFGGVALLIAAVGLYSTMAYLVSQRAREIGIRIALGASRRHVIARIGAHGASVVATGLAAGLLVSAMGTPWLADLLYETSPRDPWVFATVAIVLAAAGVAAAVVPARRSTAVDPLVVLKAD
jgi:predicted permease